MPPASAPRPRRGLGGSSSVPELGAHPQRAARHTAFRPKTMDGGGLGSFKALTGSHLVAPPPFV